MKKNQNNLKPIMWASYHLTNEKALHITGGDCDDCPTEPDLQPPPEADPTNLP